MKIVHVIEPLAGGMVTFLHSLVESLPNDLHLIVHGSREHIVPLEQVKQQFPFPNVKFIFWPSARRSLHPIYDGLAFFELLMILRQLKKKKLLDVVHLHCSKGGFLGRMACRVLGIQQMVIYTPNGAPFLAGKSGISNTLYKWLEKLAASFGGQVVCCSPSEQKMYDEAGINAITINNGIDYAMVTRQNQRRTSRTRFRVLTSGRIVDQKNPAGFNRIAAYFEQMDDFEFIWVGDGEDRHQLTAGNIHVTGWLPPSKANQWVASADVYLSTANYEGLPFAVLEALALRLPVLLRDCIGNRDLLNGLNGAVFSDEQQAIYRLLEFSNNKSMLNVMGQYSASHCKKNFNLSDTLRKYETLYQRACLSLPAMFSS